MRIFIKSEIDPQKTIRELERFFKGTKYTINGLRLFRSSGKVNLGGSIESTEIRLRSPGISIGNRPSNFFCPSGRIRRSTRYLDVINFLIFNSLLNDFFDFNGINADIRTWYRLRVNNLRRFRFGCDDTFYKDDFEGQQCDFCDTSSCIFIPCQALYMHDSNVDSYLVNIDPHIDHADICKSLGII